MAGEPAVDACDRGVAAVEASGSARRDGPVAVGTPAPGPGRTPPLSSTDDIVMTSVMTSRGPDNGPPFRPDRPSEESETRRHTSGLADQMDSPVEIDLVGPG